MISTGYIVCGAGCYKTSAREKNQLKDSQAAHITISLNEWKYHELTLEEDKVPY
jgi:hypothetical protein